MYTPTRTILSICGAAVTGALVGVSCYQQQEKQLHPSLSSVRCTVGGGGGVENNSSDSTAARQQQPNSVTGCNAAISLHCNTAISRSRKLIKHMMIEKGIPGAVVAVSKNGSLVWSEGMGYSDVENDVVCTPDSVMRIASISKPLTTVALLQLWQKGVVDLDAPIQTYVPQFPKKLYNGEEVKVTTRQLLSHLGGIRHYKKGNTEENDENTTVTEQDGNKKKKGAFDHTVDYKEYYITEHYNTIEESLKLFAEDELVSAPGETFNYTTHGWTLVSGVIEKASGMDYLSYMEKYIFNPLGMTSTAGEFHEPLVFNRSRHYVHSDIGALTNTPYVDLSYKWAGGGLISNAQDLLKFGNALLTSYQLSSEWQTTERKNTSSCTQNELQSRNCASVRKLQCILDPSTVNMMWTPVTSPNKDEPHLRYGMGWYLREQGAGEVVGGKRCMFSATHTGAAIGASSALVIMSDSKTSTDSLECRANLNFDPGCSCPKGVVVAVIFNLQEVKGVHQLGMKIAEEFQNQV